MSPPLLRRTLSGTVLVATLIVIAAARIPSSTPTPPAKEAPPPTLTLADWPLESGAKLGKRIFQENCVGCHGDTGLGDGEAAADLNPRPRNLRKGYFKFRSTASSKLPTRADLLHVITCGLPGSSMPSFRLLPEAHRDALVSFVLTLAAFEKARLEAEILRDADGLTMPVIVKDHLPEIRKKVEAEMAEGAVPVTIGQRPPTTPESVEKGRARYAKECASCHGKTGVGDGPSSYALRDWEDAEIRPRDFTTGVFRAGSAPTDLFLRLKSGLNGTPMPAISGSDDDLWALVDFILTLRTQAPEASDHAGCPIGGTTR